MEMSSTGRLRWIWWAAIFTGAVSFLIGLLWANSAQGPGLDLVWAVAGFGLSVIIYNMTFFVLCSIFVPDLSALVEDDTEVHGDNVVHVVRHAETGDGTLDFYIRAYAGARATSAVAIGAGIMIALALIFF